MKITFLGHAAFALEHEGTNVLIDPFLNGNPAGAASADEVAADAILITHGHADHYGDAVAIAKRTGASVTALVEIANEIAGQLDDGHPVNDPNFGGTVAFDWGWAKYVPAWHTSTTPNGTVTPPAGILLEFGGKLVYHLGDTALFSDLKLVAPRDRQIDVAIVPIGGHYTMDRHDAVIAAEFVGAREVIPCHYDTFPPIETDAEAFKHDVEMDTGSSVVVLRPGESHEPS